MEPSPLRYESSQLTFILTHSVTPLKWGWVHAIRLGTVPSLVPIRTSPHPRATPEKALLDWLYLANSSHSTLTPPSRGDVDVDVLNKKRLARLAKAMNLVEILGSWDEGRFVLKREKA